LEDRIRGGGVGLTAVGWLAPFCHLAKIAEEEAAVLASFTKQ